MRWLGVIALVACGDKGTPVIGIDPISGERLRLRWHAFADGARQPEPDEFFDAARGEACRPAAWADGRTYCTPMIEGGTAFTNSFCTRELGTAISAEPPRYFARMFAFGDVGGISKVFVGGAKTSRPDVLFAVVDGQCVASGSPAGFDFYELGAEVEDLVRLRDRVVTDQGELGVDMLFSDDGMRVPRGLHDALNDLGCDIAADGSCAPARSDETTLFHDPACSIPEVPLSGDAPTESVISTRSETTGCLSYFNVGIHVGPVPLYQRVGGECREVESPGGSLYIAGEQLQLPSAASEVDATPGRIKGQTISSGELRIASPVLFDSELGVPCTRSTIRGGEGCFPASVVRLSNVYSDAGCTVVLDAAEVPVRECDPLIEFAIITAQTTTRFARLGDPVGAFVKLGGQCVEYARPGFAVRPMTEFHELEDFAFAALVDE